MRSFSRYDFPDWWDTEDRRAYIVESDWNDYERLETLRDLYRAEQIENWLHDGSATNRTLWIMEELSATPYAPKQGIDTRREKTREYRKRRPRVQKYQPDYSLAAGLIYTFLGAQP